MTAPSPPPTFRLIPGTGSQKILCVADIRGDIKRLNEMIKETGAVAVIHTGDFGFLDRESPARMSPRVLRHTLQYTPLIPTTQRASYLSHPHGPSLFTLLSPATHPSTFILSQLPQLLSGALTLPVPTYVVYGPTEDIRVLEKFRTGEYEVQNLEVLDEAVTKVLEVGGVRLRLMGLGGSVQMSKIFDNGDGTGTIAGGQGMVWATALQIGELVDTAAREFDPSETRVLVTHGSVGREGLLAQLSMVLKADLTISGSLHFRYVTSFNEFNVQADAEMYKDKMLKSKKAFLEVYESAKTQLDSVIQPDQRDYLQKALAVAHTIPNIGAGTDDDAVWKNIWHWNLTEAAYGHLVLTIKDGRVSAETQSTGFHFGYRRPKGKAPSQAPAIANSTNVNTTSQMTQGNQSGPKPPHVNARSVTQPIAKPAPIAKPTPTPAPVVAIPQSTTAAKSAPMVLPHPAASAMAAPVAPGAKSGPIERRDVRKPNGPLPNGGMRPENKPAPKEPTPASVKESTADEKESLSTQKKGKGREREKQGGKPEGSAGVNGSATDASASADQGSKQQKDKKPQQQRNKDEKPQPLQPSADTNEVVTEGAGETEVVLPDAESVDAPKSAETTTNGTAPVFAPSLYLNKLPDNPTEDEIAALFGEEIKPKIQKIKIKNVSNYNTGQRRYFAYVEFLTEEEAKEALANHTDEIRGTTIAIMMSTPQPPKTGGFGNYRGGARGGFSNRGGNAPRGNNGGSRAGRGGFGPRTGQPGGGEAAKSAPQASAA